MVSNYAFTPNIWPSIITVLLLIALAIYGGRRRAVPGALPFMVSCLFAALWAAGLLMEYAALEFTTRAAWIQFEMSWQLPILIAVTCFFLDYAWPGRWLTRRNLAMLSIPALIFALLMLTNDLHHLVWSSFEFGPVTLRRLTFLGWTGVAYAFVLTVLSIVVLAWLFLHSPQHRWPVVIMLAGLVVGRTVYFLDKAEFIRAVLPAGMFGMAFEFLMYAIALFGFRIFDPISLARQTVVAQMSDGMLVLDSLGQVSSLNPAAQAILEVPGKQLQGRPIRELLPDQAMLAGDLLPGRVEICLPGGQKNRYYQMEISPLNDWRGSEIGHLLLLHDVTGQKQAQAQIIEQQRALAMLQEREQLARELHDSIGQILGYAGFQLETVHHHIASGQTALAAGQPSQSSSQLAVAESQLTRLIDIIAEAHADLREVILNLRVAPSGQQPFFAALQHYVDSFSQNYSLQARLTVAPGASEENLLDMAAQMQVFRIIQEALSNARKHAGASRVQVDFERQDGCLRVCIQDDGQGFDVAQALNAGSSHLGLRFMRERAESIGGSLRVNSTVGAGACVELELPVETSLAEDGQ
jgi:signal transduction histidine kinase